MIHVPVKVKHHHHTHTVVKHVHHPVPIHYDHESVHVIHPTHETHEDYEDYHVPHGRMILHQEEPEDDYDNYERFMRKRSKNKQKLFNNRVIGWKGRSDFDKIASEYLASIKRHRVPDNDYDERYEPYEDDHHKK